jgi:hypothetical protein
MEGRNITPAIESSSMGQCLSLRADPNQMISVFAGFNFKRLLAIHSFISNTHADILGTNVAQLLATAWS